MEELLSFLNGRRLLRSEIPNEWAAFLSDSQIKKFPTMGSEGKWICCQRCGTYHLKVKSLIKNLYRHFYYCSTCIQLGRVESDKHFYGIESRVWEESEKHRLIWKGELTQSQKKVANQVVKIIQKKEDLLIHAVTGAGKTEMLFLGISEALKNGNRVCIASPRVDVCLELSPRIQEVFPSLKVALLYGKQEEAYTDSQLVICTTHQLLRFYQTFDVLIVDEVDAFPFVNNQMLYYGTSQAKKHFSSTIYLTATPTEGLLKAVASGELKVVKVPVRYHQKALPVPEFKWLWQWQQRLNQARLPKKFLELVYEQIISRRRTILFCPNIHFMEKLEEILKGYFSDYRITSAHSKDEGRYQKVLEMRNAEYDLFLSTTILERGVTFKNIDVIVIGSNHRVFSKASLIQIAGRAGRSAEFPDGRVIFIHDGQTREMKACLKSINEMNRIGQEEGLLKS